MHCYIYNCVDFDETSLYSVEDDGCMLINYSDDEMTGLEDCLIIINKVLFRFWYYLYIGNRT